MDNDRYVKSAVTLSNEKYNLKCSLLLIDRYNRYNRSKVSKSRRLATFFFSEKSIKQNDRKSLLLKP